MINFEWMSGPVVVWNVVSGEKETTIRSTGDHVAYLTFSSDGKRLLAKNYVGGRMRLLDVETGAIEAEEPGVPDTHGHRTLTGFPCKDLHQEVNTPAGHSPLHRDAVSARMLLQKCEGEAAKPC